MKQDIIRDINDCIKNKEVKLEETYKKYRGAFDEKSKEYFLTEWFKLKFRLEELKKEKKMIRKCTRNVED